MTRNKPISWERREVWHHHSVHKLVNTPEPQKKWGPETLGVYVYAHMYECIRGFPGGLAVKNLPVEETGVRSLGWEDPWRREWQPTPVYLPGKSHGQRLVGYSPWGHKESDTT